MHVVDGRCNDCRWAIDGLCPGQWSRMNCAPPIRTHAAKPYVSPADLAASRHAIYARFGRKRRIKIENASVLCASDSRQFAALQFMLGSLILSHDVPVTLVDLGMEPGHRAWVSDQGVNVIDKPSLIVPESVDHWQNWNKPCWFDHASTDRVLWLDSDCVVGGDLRPLFAAIDDGPLIMTDVFTKKLDVIPNQSALYDMLPIAEKDRIFTLNSGVLGFDRKRDDRLTWLWREMTHLAANDAKARSWFSWFDQGTLIYACEKLKIKITKCSAWNDARPTIRYYATVYATPAAMIAEMPAESTICHYLGVEKPYGWREVPLSLKPAPNLETYILAHEDVERPQREFVDILNLSWRDPDNRWGESRVFEQIPVNAIESEYIGLATMSWVKKYESQGAWAPWEFGELTLAPSVVWTAEMAPGGWPEVMDASSPGILPFIDELRCVSGLIEVQCGGWSNNYVMHRDVYAALAGFHKRMKSYFVDKYGPDALYRACDPRKSWGYLGEAFSVHWLASRGDLDIRPIRRPGFATAGVEHAPVGRRSPVIVTRLPIIDCEYVGCKLGCGHYLCKKYGRETTPVECRRCVAIGGNR